MEILILFIGIVVPLAITGFVALHKERQEERREKAMENN